MVRTILIVGGSGLIGTFFKNFLESAGHKVCILTRNRALAAKDGFYLWDVEADYLDINALQNVDVIVNLTGAAIADRRWTSRRKKILRDSRVKSTVFLERQLRAAKIQVKTYIGASAVGIYGNRGDEILAEDSEVGKSDFLVDLCKEWESAHDGFSDLVGRVVKMRIGVVLTNEGGAWPQLKRSVVAGIGALFAKGNQFVPWIHQDDLIRVMAALVADEGISGVVNAVGPNPVTNRTFTLALIRAKKGIGWVFPIPALFLQLILGEMAAILLQSQRVIPAKLLRTGALEFKYATIDLAIDALLKDV
jgi:uncharacterized protein (TIGR01777 family)